MERRRQALLALPVPEAVERIARNHLAAATRELARLKRPASPGRLHAFRVAVRRLRSLLRAYRPWLGKVAGRKTRRKLRRLTRATNAVRDIDVELAWLASVRGDLASEDRPGFDWLERRLAVARRNAYRKASAAMLRDFPAVARRVRRRLGGDGQPQPPAFRAAFLELLDASESELRSRLAAIAGPNDEAAIHRARIQVKRLRYLVEPLRSELPEAREAVRPLKKLQNILGDLHDRHVLEQALATALDEAAAEKARRLHRLAVGGKSRKAVADARRRDEAIGLVVLAARAREERNDLFGRLRRRLTEARTPALATELSALRAAVAPGSPAAPPRSKAGR